MGVLAPFAGLAVDHYGPRKLMFVGAIFLGIGLLLLSRVNTLVMYYAAFIVIGIGASVCSGIVTMTVTAISYQLKELFWNEGVVR